MKIVNDSVYGPVVLEPVNWVFIDTPAFQRLRNISQLGMTPWVYPTACHHRFEHCIGTAYLAGKLVRRIRQSQPELGINDKHVMCAELAGLLHDIGHGPFSHCWDADVLPALGVNYAHEKASIDIIDYLLDKNDGAIRKMLATEEKFKLTEEYIRLVKEMIYGVLPGYNEKLYAPSDPQSFLYDIVSNSFCGLDVDKLDYLGRDGRALGTVNLHMGDLERIMLTATVVQPEEGKGYHVVWRDVSAPSLHNVFQLRHRLHCIAYKHKTTVCVQMMFADAMTTEEMKKKHFEVYDTSDPNDPKLNVEKFLQLTDTLFWDTLFSQDEKLAESRAILERISARDLYPALSSLRLEAEHDLNSKYSAETIRQELMSLIEEDSSIGSDLKKKCQNALIIKKCTLALGSTPEKGKNPLDLLQYKNQSGDFIESSKNCYASFMFFPKHIAEVDIRLYSRCRSSRTEREGADGGCNDILKRVYKAWAERTAGKTPLNY